ncbi:hypothetical protein EJB05_34995, partial [Eragrostis curvula]
MAFLAFVCLALSAVGQFAKFTKISSPARWTASGSGRPVTCANTSSAWRLLLVVVLAVAAVLAAAVDAQPGRSPSLALRARDWPLTVVGLRRTRQGALAPRLALDVLRNLTALESFNASGFALPGEIPAWFGTGLPPPLAVLDLTWRGRWTRRPRPTARGAR